MKTMNSDDSGTRPLSEIDPPERESDVLRRALTILQALLPTSWDLQIRNNSAFDALLEIRAPTGDAATVVIEAKRQMATRDVSKSIEHLRRAVVGRTGGDNAQPMVVARYLAPPTRDRLERAGIAYADATGNLRLALERPAMFVKNSGADHDPWRAPGRPLGSLKGAPAARVVRSLVDFTPPYTVPEVIERSGASTGATYRAVDLLVGEDLLEKEHRGPIQVVRWRPLIERWSRDYGFHDSDDVRSFLFPRGVETFPKVLEAAKPLEYVLTGTFAARHLAPYAPPRFAMVYVDDIDVAAERLDLRPAERGGNVLLAANRDEVAFVRAQEVEGIMTAAPSQIAVDLLTGPGRSPSEGQALLDWMEANERAWRE